MEWLQEFFSRLHNLEELIAWAGLAGITAIVFCETGLLAGFFLPGDSLLFTAGFFASQGKLDIVLLNVCLMAAAIVGDSTGYAIGHFAGPRLFRRPDSFFFKKEYVERTHAFFDRYGGKTIILARFVPIVRTFAPTVAGVGRMTYRKFLAFNIIGGVLWVATMTLGGYFLGRVLPDAEKQLHWIVLAVIVISFAPVIHELVKHKRSRTP